MQMRRKKMSKTECKLQEGMDRVCQVCDNYDLTISTKNEVVYQQAAEKPYSEPAITVNGQIYLTGKRSFQSSEH